MPDVNEAIPREAVAAIKDADIEFIDDNLFQLTLTRENKAEIFEYAISKLDEGQDETDLILRNLTTWCPDVAALFLKRSSSTVLDTPFRLIYPKDALTAFDNGLYVRQYMAISYCWHSDDFPSPDYATHEHWPVSKPFVDAILSEKNHPRVGIWMDQLCIDQNDKQDIQKAVAAMDIIYRSCLRLLVLLEDVTLTAEEAQLHEKYDHAKHRYGQYYKHDPEDSATFASFYTKINKARWWERAWCFHEFSVNEPWSDKRQSQAVHNATVIMNGPNGSTVKIKWINLHLIMSSALTVLPPEVRRAKFSSEEILLGIYKRKNRTREAGEDPWKASLMAQHNKVAQKGCTKLADRLSIMINMSGLGISYAGEELKSKDEALYLNALLSLAVGELYPLSMMSNHLVRFHEQPTWLARHAVEDLAIPDFQPNGTSGIHRISAQSIELDLIFFKSIGQMVRDEEALRPTYEVFPEIIPNTLPNVTGIDGGLERIMRIPPAEDSDSGRRQFLAGCIANGPGFLKRLWEQLNRDVLQPEYNDSSMRDIQPCAALRIPAETLLNIISKPTVSTTPASIGFDVDDAQLFLSWLTDPRSLYYINLYSISMPCTIDGDEAFMIGMSGNDHYFEGPPEELRAAIPTDLLQATCTQQRLWILRLVKTEGREDEKVEKWRIVGKGMLLGEPDLMQEVRSNGQKEDAVVTLTERSIVVG